MVHLKKMSKQQSFQVELQEIQRTPCVMLNHKICIVWRIPAFLTTNLCLYTDVKCLVCGHNKPLYAHQKSLIRDFNKCCSVITRHLFQYVQQRSTTATKWVLISWRLTYMIILPFIPNVNSRY